MLSLFPELLFLAPFSAFALRVTLAVVLSMSAWGRVSMKDAVSRTVAVVEIALAVALVVGAWTQAAALATAVWMLIMLFVPRMRIFPLSTVAIALVISLSIIVTGPGAFAFDFPL